MSPEERRRLDLDLYGNYYEISGQRVNPQEMMLLYWNGYHEPDLREIERRRNCQRDVIEMSKPVVDIIVDIYNFYSTPYVVLDKETREVVESGSHLSAEGQRQLDIANALLLEIRQSVLEAYGLDKEL